MTEVVITSGAAYTDVDALASAIAYSHLLQLQGTHTKVVLRGPLNNSIVPAMRVWPFAFETQPPTNPHQVVIVDVSDPEYIDDFVEEENITAIFDHHFGFETYWKDRLGPHAVIEPVGACATLIWELYLEHKLASMVDATTANLLYTALFSNTLNFQAGITTSRDKLAFSQIQPFCTLPKDWIQQYYREREAEILKKLSDALLHDTKTKEFKNIGLILTISQLELWNSHGFITHHRHELQEFQKHLGNSVWFLTLPSIGEGINYLYTQNTRVKSLLQQAISATFNDDIGMTERLWLRKEIIRELQTLG